MRKTTTTTTTSTATNTKLKYVPKLIINGTEIKTHAKQVSCTIKDVEVTLNCCYITETELKDAYTSSFSTFAHGKEIEVYYVKSNNKVSASLYINKTLAFSSLTMQAIFTVIFTAYGIPKSTINNLYIKSNATRKQTSSSVNSIKVNSTFEF